MNQIGTIVKSLPQDAALQAKEASLRRQLLDAAERLQSIIKGAEGSFKESRQLSAFKAPMTETHQRMMEMARQADIAQTFLLMQQRMEVLLRISLEQAVIYSSACKLDDLTKRTLNNAQVLYRIKQQIAESTAEIKALLENDNCPLLALRRARSMHVLLKRLKNNLSHFYVTESVREQIANEITVGKTAQGMYASILERLPESELQYNLEERTIKIRAAQKRRQLTPTCATLGQNVVQNGASIESEIHFQEFVKSCKP
jgi:hypothetical protein